MIDVQSNVQTVIDAFARGEIVVVTDDDDRENEGDLFVAAVARTPEKMAFIIRNTCGIVCTPLPIETRGACISTPMVAENDSPHTTAFTVSVDYRHGRRPEFPPTIAPRRCAISPIRNAGAGDFVRPGHIFPLVAKEGGVLMRSGHTEAAVDLCRYAKLEPVGVICELDQ